MCKNQQHLCTKQLWAYRYHVAHWWCCASIWRCTAALSDTTLHWTHLQSPKHNLNPISQINCTKILNHFAPLSLHLSVSSGAAARLVSLVALWMVGSCRCSWQLRICCKDWHYCAQLRLQGCKVSFQACKSSFLKTTARKLLFPIIGLFLAYCTPAIPCNVTRFATFKASTRFPGALDSAQYHWSVASLPLARHWGVSIRWFGVLEVKRTSGVVLLALGLTVERPRVA